MFILFFFSSRRRHTSCALVTGVQTCALPILSRRPFFRPGFGRGVAEIVRLIHDEAAEFILIGMFFLRRLFLFRFEVPIQIAGFDPIEQAVPSTTVPIRSEEHTSELQSLMRISYAVFCLKKKNNNMENNTMNNYTKY